MDSDTGVRSAPGARVPRKVWIYWHQGWQDAPGIVKACRKSWEKRNPNWDVQCVSAESLGDLITLTWPYSSIPELTLASLSDVIRLKLLEQHGGVWADATTWCTLPLDNWIDDVTAPTGFFAYAKPAEERPMASWFLASEPANILVSKLQAAVDRLWSEYLDGEGELALAKLFSQRMDEWRNLLQTGPKHNLSKKLLRLLWVSRLRTQVDLGKHLTDHPTSPYYFWLHQTFRALIEIDPDFAQCWENTPKISAIDALALQRAGFGSPISEEMRKHINEMRSCVYKLDRRSTLCEDLSGTVLGHLFSTLNEADCK